MGIISVSYNEKNIEESSLEAHVALCAHRHQSLEKKIDNLIEQSKDNKKLILSTAVTIAIGAASGLIGLITYMADKFIK